MKMKNLLFLIVFFAMVITSKAQNFNSFTPFIQNALQLVNSDCTIVSIKKRNTNIFKKLDDANRRKNIEMLLRKN